MWLHRSVKVISGPYIGRRGTVQSIEGDVLTVKTFNGFDTFTVLTSEVKTIE